VIKKAEQMKGFGRDMGKIRIVNQAKNDPKNERYTNKIRFR
jgi:hypothetical protein